MCPIILLFLCFKRSEFSEPMDLQLDYWMVSSKEDKEPGSSSGVVVGLSGLGSLTGGGDSGQKSESKRSGGASGGGSSGGDTGSKASIKSSIWRMQIHRLGVLSSSTADQPTFSMQYWLKEKKSKGTQIGYSRDIRVYFFMAELSSTGYSCSYFSLIISVCILQL